MKTQDWFDQQVSNLGMQEEQPSMDVVTALPEAKNDWFDQFLQQKEKTDAILPKETVVTQRFNNPNKIEVFSGGRSRGTNLRAPVGTPVKVPKGLWQVVKTHTASKKPGYIGNADNQGYGNAVMVQNPFTGEKLHFTHLSEVDVEPGQLISNQYVGKTGATGNVTGPHLNLEYYTSAGNVDDVLSSPYAAYIPLAGKKEQ